MEAVKIKKRCKHLLTENTCSLCLGMPRSRDQRDIFDYGTRRQLTGTRKDFAEAWLLDDDLVQENAQSLL